ncbi:MAG: hypothetical protein IKA87_01080 [Lentisphaeria bacterium]|nr:hypothetical protein [Lentisphaeria bacterium]
MKLKLPNNTLWALLLLVLAGCSSGIGVRENSPDERRLYGVTDYSAGKMSSGTVNLLGNFLLYEQYRKDPASVLNRLEQLYRESPRREIVTALADTALQAGYRFRSEPDTAGRYFLASALYSCLYLKYLDNEKELYDEQRLRMIRINNLASTELFFYLKSRNLNRSSGFRLSMPYDGRQIHFKAPEFKLPVAAEHIADMIPCANYTTRNLTHDTRVFGMGVPLVAKLKKGCRDIGGVLISELPVAVTLVIDFDTDADFFNTRAVLRYIYSRTEDHFELGKRKLPLAADFSTPLANAVGTPPVMNFLARTFKVAEAAKITGLYHFEPYDDKRIPVVFVHGLMSDARTWSQMLNTLLHDQVLRKKYQFLGFSYSSGNPIFVSGGILRRNLAALRERLVREKRSTEKFDKMVLIGHSMGGLLSRLQITECSAEIVKKEFGIQDLEKVKKVLTGKQQKRLAELINFAPAPFVKRVIFIAVPHRGSGIAISWIGRFGASLIKLPSDIVAANMKLLMELAGKYNSEPEFFRTKTGIDNLRPDDGMLKLLGKLEMSSGVPCHSIIGSRAAQGIPGGSDGVVPYSSSHLDSAASELVVKSGHSVHRNPLAIQEVRRILLLHAESKGEKVK